jgi:hypothetical protein
MTLVGNVDVIGKEEGLPSLTVLLTRLQQGLFSTYHGAIRLNARACRIASIESSESEMTSSGGEYRRASERKSRSTTELLELRLPGCHPFLRRATDLVTGRRGRAWPPGAPSPRPERKAILVAAPQYTNATLPQSIAFHFMAFQYISRPCGLTL